MKLNYYKYRFPFAVPLQTSKKTFEYREGIFLEYSNNGFFCYGDVAPLPGYSSETLKDVQKKIGEITDDIAVQLMTDNPSESLQDFYKEKELPASLQFGLDSIAYQIEAHHEGKNLQDFLFPYEAIDQIPVNALGTLLSEQYLNDVRQQIANGYTTIKFKIGIDFDLELKRLQKIRSDFPDLTIRLDANQAWSTETALRKIQKLESLNIEYIEEPLQNATPENFDLLSEYIEIPLALDESVSHLSYWPNLLPFTSYLILKPMIIGNFRKNFETKRLADTHCNKAVVTTSLESSIGRHITAVLASGLGSPQTAHGLSTGNLLEKDVDSDLAYISKGQFNLKKHYPVKIDFQNLDEVSSITF